MMPITLMIGNLFETVLFLTALVNISDACDQLIAMVGGQGILAVGLVLERVFLAWPSQEWPVVPPALQGP